MVYKIIGKFEDKDFEKILTKLSKYFSILYIDSALYIALKSIDQKDEGKDLMSKIFKPVRDFYIEEINEKNIMKEAETIVNWCRDALVSLDRQRYENENQEKLHKVWEAMDKMEAELQAKLAESEVQSSGE